MGKGSYISAKRLKTQILGDLGQCGSDCKAKNGYSVKNVTVLGDFALCLCYRMFFVLISVNCSIYGSPTMVNVFLARV